MATGKIRSPDLTWLFHKIWSVTVTAACVFVFTILLWHLLQLFPGDRWLPVRLVTYSSPWLFMVLIPATIIVMIGRRRWALAGAVVALILFAGRFSYLLPDHSSPATAAAMSGQLRLMTHNVHYSNNNAPEIAQMITAQQPDIVALQEVLPGLASQLSLNLVDLYPYTLYSEPERLLLVSRYPLHPQPTPENLWRAIQAMVDTPAGPVRVWNFHPKPTLKPGRWQSHVAAYTTLSQAITAEQAPQIVLGDFNTNDQSEMYDLIAAHLTDVHHAVGDGFGFTFPAPDVARQRIPPAVQSFLFTPALARLDHIFASHHFTPIDIEVLSDSYGSDHLPVVATVGVTEGG